MSPAEALNELADRPDRPASSTRYSVRKGFAAFYGE
jgi:hypothetical protein